MNKFTNRVTSEFEDILLILSKNINTTHSEALAAAKKYSEDFCKKKRLSSNDQEEIYNFCVELVLDWFPDTNSINYASF